MIKIAVCDDESAVCSEIEKFILKYAKEESLVVNVDIFSTGHELMKKLETGEEYGLIFLDIEINNENGSDIGNFIRNNLKNKSTEIVYISYHKGYAMSLFESSPLDFIIKPITYEKVKRMIEKYIGMVGSDNKFFTITSRKFVKRVLLKDILYFERSGLYTSVTTSDDKYLSHNRFNDIKSELPFFKVHKSFIVNLKHVDEYRYSEMIMSNGNFVPISRSHRQEIRKIYINEMLI
ncbi:MAG: LytTR family DNA-binding domain-containing protein [Clostridiales bacterium]|nr:LytTR family DNA-binding domain-containing protein [Clostridiales bacterium]